VLLGYFRGVDIMQEIIGSTISYFSEMSLPFMIFFVLVNGYIILINKNPIIGFLGFCFDLIIMIDMFSKGSSILDFLIIFFVIAVTFIKIVAELSD
jgi:hypothetical protein